MKRLDKLTDEQEAQLPAIRDEWIKIGLCTEPADRPRAEAALTAAYRQAGLEPPKFVWCGSPLSAGLTRVILLEMAKNGKMPASVWASVRASVGDSVWASVYGQHDASWLAFYDTFRRFGLADITKKLEPLTEFAKAANWALPHGGICWISERHCVVLQDERRRLHCETGPAVKYPDGLAIYAWHGTRVPAKWIEDRASLTAKAALTWENLEQRRAACELLGWETILQELDAKTIDTDPDPEIGELVEVSIPDVGRERFLRVTCGTGRRFALAVPPDMKTALEANSWTYDIPADLLQRKEHRT